MMQIDGIYRYTDAITNAMAAGLNYSSPWPSSLSSSVTFLQLLSTSSSSSSSSSLSPSSSSSSSHFITLLPRTAFQAFTLKMSRMMGIQLSWTQIAVLLVLLFSAYLLLVRSLRFRRIRQLEAHYNYRNRASMAAMTDHQAWEIQRAMAQYEFPFTVEKSLQFALFRTYGIPSISSTLMKTKQFSNSLYSGKRYVDTCVMIGEFIVHDPASVRSRLALSRTKYLHHGYRKSGAVREEDMLYTLSLFATEPLRFIDSYEWRSATELERCALGVFWKSVGDALGIDYAAFLPSAKAAAAASSSADGEGQGQGAVGSGYRDGIHWLEEITAWAQDYEIKAMIPAKTNRDTADQTTAILTFSIPPSLKFIGLWFVSYMMDERLRQAMLYPRAPALVEKMFSLVFQIRKSFIRYLCLPRPEFMRVVSFTENPDPHTGSYHVTAWTAEPFYVKPTAWNRWLSPSALLARLMGLPLPGDQGEKYHPHGYDLANMGPASFASKGKEFLDQEMHNLEKTRRGQCPFF